MVLYRRGGKGKGVLKRRVDKCFQSVKGGV